MGAEGLEGRDGADGRDEGGEVGDDAPPSVRWPSAPTIHRLRDLDRRGRWVAAGLAALLVLIPVVAAVVNLSRWEPQGDDALIELRAYDVGTVRNPLVGQPSTSGTYGSQADNVAHPGPLGFAVIAPGARLLGPVAGTLLSTAAVTAAALLSVAWMLFRLLGPRGGAVGAALGALAAFSAGAAGQVDPLSSNFGRFALLAAAVGVWAVLSGDLRLVPLTVAFWSFAAQQHLSVLPAAAVLAGAGAVGIAFWVWRVGPGHRARALAWVGGGALVGLVLWAPVLWQEVTGEPGNLTALSEYSGDPERVDLGVRSAVGQVSTVLGPRPFLGWSSPRGWDLVAPRSTVAVVATFAAVGAVLALAGWWRRRDPRMVAAVAMVGVLAVAGVVTGTNIPDSPEQGRLNFFHWAFALSFFELLVVGWLLALLVPKVTPNLTHGRAITAAVVAAVVLIAVALTPVVVDRRADHLGQPIETAAVRELLDQVETSEELAAVDHPLLVLVNGDDRYIQVGDTVGARLEIDGRRIQFPDSSRGFVHPDRLADPCTVPGALVVSLVLNDLAPPPGVEIASVDGAPSLDRDALARLEAQAEGQEVVFGPDLQAALDAMPGDRGGLLGATIALRLGTEPQRVLLDRASVDLLLDHPTESPKLDPEDLQALRDSYPPDANAIVATEITAHLLDRGELEQFRPDLVEAC